MGILQVSTLKLGVWILQDIVQILKCHMVWTAQAGYVWCAGALIHSLIHSFTPSLTQTESVFVLSFLPFGADISLSSGTAHKVHSAG